MRAQLPNHPDRRDGLRLQAHQTVQVTVLGQGADPVEGTLDNFSSGGMRLLLDLELPMDAALRVEWEDSMVLGDVRYCVPQGDRYAVGLEIQHTLTDMAGLARLAERMLDAGVSMQPTRKA